MGTLVLYVAPVLLLPLNAGLEAPGPTASVGPMVHVPSDLAHDSEGTFILTTVVPQAPIVLGEWLYAHIDRSIRLTNAAEIVPPNTTPQQLSIQGFEDLQRSEKTAIVVGLNLAGYQASLSDVGAEIVSILPDSRAIGILMLGDEITSVNGQPVSAPPDVSRILGETAQATTARLQVKRGSATLDLDVPLTPATSASPTPRIGITISPTGDKLDLPFPVTIEPRKVNGGPSAGLMFTLAVYDALTPQDLTGGHRIAGTGTIDLDGTVGPIGGVQQKVAAAERAGAEYFLCPPDNYEDAQAAAKHIDVVEVDSADAAIAFLKTLTPRQ